MGTTTDKLNHLINTKEGIRQEINRAYSNEEISNSDTFNSYIQKLEEHPYYIMRYIERSIENIKVSNAASIGDGAFSDCSSLTEASFPNAISIGISAFQNCSSLTTIYVGINISTVCTLSSTNAFTNCTSLTNIYVPASLVDSYKSATNWSSYADKIKADAEPVECITLSITADDVAAGNITSTTVYYTAECTYKEGGILQKGTKVFTGKATSNSFEQNTSRVDTVQREVSFTFLGKTATTTITQGAWLASGGTGV